jgi:uncharacterized protein (TIGR02996 family)
MAVSVATKEEVLLGAVVRAPDDDGPRLAYAAWLEQAGRPQAADLVRLQCEYARLDPDDGRTRNAHYQRWSGLTADVAAAWQERLDGCGVEVSKFGFERGLPAELQVTDGTALAKRAAKVFGLLPIHELSWDGQSFGLEPMTARPEFRRIRKLVVANARLGPYELGKLLDTKRIGQLVELRLVATYMGNEGARLLTSCGPLPHLAVIDLRSSAFDLEGLALLAAATNLPALRRLSLGSNRVGAEGAAVIASGPAFARLEYLGLSSTALSKDAAAPLGRGQLTALTRLDLGFNELGPSGLAALLAGPGLPRLQSLSLRHARMNAAAMEHLAGSCLARELRDLDVGQNNVGDDGVRALAASPALTRLESLHLFDAGITRAGYDAAVARFGNIVSGVRPAELKAGPRRPAKSAPPAKPGARTPPAKHAANSRRPPPFQLAYLVARRHELIGKKPSRWVAAAASRLGIDAARIPVEAAALAATGPRGWEYGRPPGLKPGQWPLSPRNGMPMAHILTVEVPEPFRTQGPGLVAISFFQSSMAETGAPGVRGAAAVLKGKAAPRGQADAPFWRTLARHARVRHPQQRLLVDEIDVPYALIWLTPKELGGAPCELPARAGFEGSGADLSGVKQGNALACDRPPRPLMVVPVLDPNAGKPPVDYFDLDSAGRDEQIRLGKYIPAASLEDLDDNETVTPPDGLQAAHFPDWNKELHFGGTSYACQRVPRGLSPYYMEIEDGFGGINLGGGNGQLDLKKHRFVWACP